MANAPTEEQIGGFMTKLRTFRETLGPDDQKLLDTMYIAAMGKHEEQDDEVQSYWVAAGPRGVAAGGPYGGSRLPRGAPRTASTSTGTGAGALSAPPPPRRTTGRRRHPRAGPLSRAHTRVRDGSRACPTDARVEAFETKLRAFRDTLPEDEQRLLNTMYYAAMGQHEAKDEDTHAYWVAAGPRGVVAGPGIARAPGKRR